VGKVLGIPLKLGVVGAHHYQQLIDMIADSVTFDEFLQRKGKADSAWSDIDRSKVIHDQRRDKESDELEKIARSSGTFDVAARFCEIFSRAAGAHLDPGSFQWHFSAAVEYLEALLGRIRGGAKLRKNDPGWYGDFQLFFYLAEPGLNLLTREDFSDDIRNSPQRTRIVGLDSLP